MPTLNANGVELFYEEQGVGSPLILIQGLTYATPMWHWQVDELKKHFRVVAFDNRGSGQSAKPDVPYSIKMFAEDAVALMDALGIRQGAVLGISMGGLIAQELALSFPDRVTHLILCCTLFGGPSAVQPSNETLAYLAQFSENPSDDLVRQGIAYGTAPGFLERHPDRVALLTEFKQQTRPPRYAYFRQLLSGIGFSSEDRFGNLRIPTLILAGSDDRIVPGENAQSLHKLIAGSQLMMINDTGHHPHMEHPEVFNQAVIQFIQSNTSPH